MTSNLGGRSGGSQSDSVEDVSETKCVKPSYYPRSEDKLNKDCAFYWNALVSFNTKDNFDYISITVNEIRDSI